MLIEVLRAVEVLDRTSKLTQVLALGGVPCRSPSTLRAASCAIDSSAADVDHSNLRRESQALSFPDSAREFSKTPRIQTEGLHWFRRGFGRGVVHVELNVLVNQIQKN